MSKTLEDLIHHIFSSWDKPYGETVKIVRDVISFELKLDGRKSTQEECEDYTKTNPGVLRIEDLSGNVIWKPS
jgi:hypothetical protein